MGHYLRNDGLSTGSTIFVGVAGYQLFGYQADGPHDGEVYVTNYPLSGSCDSKLLPVCYIPGAELQRTASDACINNGYSVSA